MVKLKQKSYLISVVVPVYNVKQYLEECIQSIIKQDIDFEKNIQLILVNDGSTDGSDEICKEYASRYPNIVAIDKPNGGVSSARNAGFKAAKADFIAFPDSDDVFSEQFYSLLYTELNKYPSIPFAVGRTKNFEADVRYHVTDGKFKETQLIDLAVTPSHIQTLQAPALFRRSAIKNVPFNENMTHSEDSEFINRVLLTNESKFAVVRDAVYYYRKRNDNSSATGVSKFRKTYYESAIKLINVLTKDAKGKDIKPPKFVQYALLYQIGWRMRASDKPDALDAKGWKQYKDALKHAINVLDDDVIMHGGVSVGPKQRQSIFVVRLAAKTKVSRLELSDQDQVKLRHEMNFHVSSISYTDKTVTITGSTRAYTDELTGFRVAAVLNDSKLTAKRIIHSETFMDEIIDVESGLEVTVPINKNSKLIFKAVEKETEFHLPISYSTSAKRNIGASAYKTRLLCLENEILIFDRLNAKLAYNATRIQTTILLTKIQRKAKNIVKRAVSSK